MSEEFKKEEINGEAAEETKAAEHTEEVKAETTAEQSAAETEKPQETAEAPKAEEKKTTTYSWVNPKISGKTGEENNSASYTGKPAFFRMNSLSSSGYSGCGRIVQPGTLCVGRSGHRKESDETYGGTYKRKPEKYDAGSYVKSYRISERKLYPHR